VVAITYNPHTSQCVAAGNPAFGRCCHVFRVHLGEEVSGMTYVKRQAVRFLIRVKAWTRHPKIKRGQTLVEYALILAVISIVAIGILLNIGQQIRGIYSMVISSQISQGTFQSH
jgi:Flp pilus assembly pilin Flp